MAVKVDERGRSILGRFTGPAYPFGPHVDSVLGAKDDTAVIISSIYNILTTLKGSMPYNPAIGSLIPSMLYEIDDDITIQLIQYYAKKDLEEQEPRIVIQSVFTTRVGEGSIEVLVNFTIQGDAYRRALSVPVRFERSMV